jgi:hypothetical protein
LSLLTWLLRLRLLLLLPLLPHNQDSNTSSPGKTLIHCLWLKHATYGQQQQQQHGSNGPNAAPGSAPPPAAAAPVGPAGAAVLYGGISSAVLYEPEEGERGLSLSVSSDKEYVILKSSVEVSDSLRRHGISSTRWGWWLAALPDASEASAGAGAASGDAVPLSTQGRLLCFTSA